MFARHFKPGSCFCPCKINLKKNPPLKDLCHQCISELFTIFQTGFYSSHCTSHKGTWGRRHIAQLILYLSSRWKCRVSLMTQAFNPHIKSPKHPSNRPSGSQSQCKQYGGEKSLPSLLVIKPQYLGHTVRSTGSIPTANIGFKSHNNLEFIHPRCAIEKLCEERLYRHRCWSGRLC